MHRSDLGLLGQLAAALGLFDGEDPNPDWFSDPAASLTRVLSNPAQREALMAFIDEALGGAARQEVDGITWLPLITLTDPPVDLALTVDARPVDGLHIGVGLTVRTTAPAISQTRLMVPLFRAFREDASAPVGALLLLGAPGGRLRVQTQVTLDTAAPVPGQPRLGGIGLSLDAPTAIDDHTEPPVFGLMLQGLQLPGAPVPRDVFVSAAGVDQLDEAVLHLVLALLQAQAEAGPPAVQALAGLLGLRSTDDLPDFPLQGLFERGPLALAQWLEQVLGQAPMRTRWLGHLATLLGAQVVGDAVQLTIGGSAAVSLAIGVDTGPTGHTRLTPALTVRLGPADTPVQIRAALLRADLVDGSLLALPSLAVWAQAGLPAPGTPVLDMPGAPAVHVDTVRIGFELDANRQLRFLLAADGVVIGAQRFATLDLSTPDAVIDAAATTVASLADSLFAGLGDVLGLVRRLLGLQAPSGLAPVALHDLLDDPLRAVAAHWRALMSRPSELRDLLVAVQTALADAGAALPAITGSGTRADPWHLPLHRAQDATRQTELALELAVDGSVLWLDAVVMARLDAVDARAVALNAATRLRVTLLKLDVLVRSAEVLPAAQARLMLTEAGATPPRIRLPLQAGAALLADGLGLDLHWLPATGLQAQCLLPSPRLSLPSGDLPLVMPQLDAAGRLTLPAADWDALQALLAHLLSQPVAVHPALAEAIALLGWQPAPPPSGSHPPLRLADLVANPAAALQAWLRPLLASPLAPRALGWLADLLGSTPALPATLAATGHPDDPWRLALAGPATPAAALLPELVAWLPPAGPAPALNAARDLLQNWLPGLPALTPAQWLAALQADARRAPDLADLLRHRLLDQLQDGLERFANRCADGDGRLRPPVAGAVPAGVRLHQLAVAATQLWEQVDVAVISGRSPDLVVHVAVGEQAWAAMPADRCINLTGSGLSPAMFTLPPADSGVWFVALGSRADCRAPGDTDDGTAQQAARLSRVLNHLSSIDPAIVLVALAGAGHAARIAADQCPAVADLVLVGTPLSDISLSVLTEQPMADAVQLLGRLLPPPPATGAPADNSDLTRGRALLDGLLPLADQPEPTAELRLPPQALPAPRAGLAVNAVFGVLTAAQVADALTAVVAAGLNHRAAVAAAAAALAPLLAAAPTGWRAGLRWSLPVQSAGDVRITGQADLLLLAHDVGPAGVVAATRTLRVQLGLADRQGWLMARPEMALRAVSVEMVLPLDGSAASTATTTITLHDARLFGQRWERLVLGTGADAVPALPEARVLLSAVMQRVQADVGHSLAVALGDVLEELGLLAAEGGLVADALDQLVLDPLGLLRQRLAAPGGALADALRALLGPLGASVDLTTDTVRVQAGGPNAGRFGWLLDLTCSPAGCTGQFQLGVRAPEASQAHWQLQLDAPVAGAAPTVRLVWLPVSGPAQAVALWPVADVPAAERLLARWLPAVVAQAGLQGLRSADTVLAPVLEAALDALDLLVPASEVAAGALRPVRPLLAWLDQPAAWWQRQGAASALAQRGPQLLNALRLLWGQAAAAPGAPATLVVLPGVSVSWLVDGPRSGLSLAIDAAAWVAPAAGQPHLQLGLTAGLWLTAGQSPVAALAAQLGLPGASAGRPALHLALDNGQVRLFLRPASGADVPLLPFAGLGSLAGAAGSAVEAALPFLLDTLAAQAANVGPLVQQVGDLMRLRTGAPPRFDAAALRAWAQAPVAALKAAAPGASVALLQPLVAALRGVVPAALTLSSIDSSGGAAIRCAVGVFSLTWTPSTGSVQLAVTNLIVPDVLLLDAAFTLSDAGVQAVDATVRLEPIDIGGAHLRPWFSVVAGAAPGRTRQVSVGLLLDDVAPFKRLSVCCQLDDGTFHLVASDGPFNAPHDVPALPVVVTPAVSPDAPPAVPPEVAQRAVQLLLELVAAVALAQPAVTQLLNTPVGTATSSVGELLKGVLLKDVSGSFELDTGLFEATLSSVQPRVLALLKNIVSAGIVLTVDGLTVSLLELAPGGPLGLQLGLSQRLLLVDGEVRLWLENDDRWITPNPPGDGGLFVGFLSTTPTLAFSPSLVVNGLGLRVGKATGPLLDTGLSIETVALHLYGGIDSTGLTGAGIQLQFQNLAVPMAGAGGNNPIAQGLMRDSGPTPPRPAFSPALAVQQHGSGGVSVSLTAGEPPGPWWLAIQRGFGPLYLEQVGLDVPTRDGQIQSVGVLMDGSVSMFGLSCAVDDLQLRYNFNNTSGAGLLDPANWAIDLAGLAVAADMAGVSIAGGLLKQTASGGGIQYLGMLLGRFGVYGLTLYGGYGEGATKDGERFTSFFAAGAVVGMLGGPPAFFLTGLGGGFGINRAMKLPTDLSKFGEYPLIEMLDPSASAGEPMDKLQALGTYFPMQRGTFWFAGGLSFTSFALVDGIAVIGVQVGDGLDINLLGLARMALPRPQVALVSIELALMVRFSTSEGVLWVQGQLTDNSWLLYPDIKLTGGFAYVIWFKGEHAGEFVMTLGGYHPDFHRDGYPVVPRLGLRWAIGDSIVIKAGSYFALSSEALMAGGDFEASAHFGPAWAEVRFGAHGIVYFDPFHYHVMAYARIAAGVTLDLGFLGDLTISVHLGARIAVEGPDFRGSATFEVGPIELTLEFGGSDQAQRAYLTAEAFTAKYLGTETGKPVRTQALITGRGAQPAAANAKPPDGTAEQPFVVVAEFGLTFTSTVPLVLIQTAAKDGSVTTTPADSEGVLGIGPMGQSDIAPVVTFTWLRNGAERVPFPFDLAPQPLGSFPMGVWGPPGDPSNRKVPKGEMIKALQSIVLTTTGQPGEATPPVAYHQVSIGRRKPLPLSRSLADSQRLRDLAISVSKLVPAVTNVEAAMAQARSQLARQASPTALAALRGERSAPPRFSSLAEGLESPTETVVPLQVKARPLPVADAVVDAPVALALMSAGQTDGRIGQAAATTTVKGSDKAWRTAPPTMALVEAKRSRSFAAKLVLVGTPAASRTLTDGTTTLVATARVPLTGQAALPTAVVARAGAPLAADLSVFQQAMTGRDRDRQAGARLAAGQTVVLQLPNARADASSKQARPDLVMTGAACRVVLLGLGGRRLLDTRLPAQADAKQAVSLPPGTERIVVTGLGAGSADGAAAGLLGWHAGLLMPYAGWNTAVAPGCLMHATATPVPAHGQRAAAGWVRGAELAQGDTTVSTVFNQPLRSVLIVLDDEQPAPGDLLMGLDGATRALDKLGEPLAPQLLVMGQRSVLAYDLVPVESKDGSAAPSISIATGSGIALAGVLGSAGLSAAAALALVAARGLDAALAPLAPPTPPGQGAAATRLHWQGPVRTPQQRAAARTLATRPAATPLPKTRRRKAA
ncbi:MAG: hypothetical protein CFE46_00930 [Burkholderiales bacterium PBB6]|nr:MAG: hypothetical protein CFE46_00930 [Burkholderiales bacterium PBB6]